MQSDDNGRMSDRYVCVARLPDLQTAQVAAAHLDAEGVTARLHGEALGPFPMTIGRFAETQLWVLCDQREVAEDILEELDLDFEKTD